MLPLLAAAAATAATASAAAVTPAHLRVARLAAVDAVGIDPRTPPLLSWGFELQGEGPAPRDAPDVEVVVTEHDGRLVWSEDIRGGARSLRCRAPLSSGTRYRWTVCTHGTSRRCGMGSFVTGTPGWWENASWLAGQQLRSPKVPIAGKRITSATVSVTGLGCYSLWINGLRVGDAELDPGFSTNLTERLLYSTFDVTELLLTADAVVIAARVGGGKYTPAPAAMGIYALKASLSMKFSDSKELTISTSSEWVVSKSPIIAENIYHGEVFDASLEQSGWNTLGFAPSPPKWVPANTVVPPILGPNAVFSPRLFPPIRVVKEVEAINVTRLGTSAWVFDFGNNFAGVGKIELVTGILGHNLSLVHTEYPSIAYVAGAQDMYNQLDTYIFSGAEEAGESYRPSFIYHGFRYIRVEGFPSEQAPNVTALFMHSDVTQHGSVNIDQTTRAGQVLSAIHASIVQTQACNIYSHPTDCPQREKRGWMGDAQWTAEEALLNFDMNALYANWVRSMHDVQDTGCTVVPGTDLLPMSLGWTPNSYCCRATPDGADPLHPKIFYCSPQYNQSDTAGSIPDVVPNNAGNGGSRGWPGAPTWSVAYVIIPGHVLQYTNDTDLIASHYEGIRAHVDFLARQAKYGGGVPQFGLLGDWCSVEPFCPGSSDQCLTTPGWTSGDATSAFYFLKSLEDLIDMGSAIGNSADVKKYSSMLTSAKQAYHVQFYNSTSRSYGSSQTGNAIAIAGGVVPADLLPGTIAALTANIQGRANHLSVGGVGARWILQALTAANKTDLAMDLAVQETAPSWYDFVAAGPGTLHESWGKPGVDPQQEPGSHNHIMLGGGIDPWIYHEVGGLRPGVASELRLGVECAVMTRVAAAAAETMVLGQRVRSSWRWSSAGLSLEYNATVPVGMVATLAMPQGCVDAKLMQVATGAGAVVWNLRDDGSMAQYPSLVGTTLCKERHVVELALLPGTFTFVASYEL